MRVIFNTIFLCLIFLTGFAGMMATQVCFFASVLNFQQAEIKSVVNIFGVVAVLVSSFLCWCIYEQELKE